MGLAASQARILLLTARKSDLEYRSQCLTQRKMVLAQQTEQLAKDYSSKISNRKLKFVYNMDGSSTQTKTEDLSYYSLGANNPKFVGEYRVINAQGAIIVASVDDIPKQKVRVPVYCKVTTDEEGNVRPVEIKKDVYSEVTNDDLGKNHGDTTNPKYNEIYVQSYLEDGSVGYIKIQNSDGTIVPDAAVKYMNSDGSFTTYPVYSQKTDDTKGEASLSSYDLTSYGSSTAKYVKSVTTDYLTTTEDKSGDSDYQAYTYSYVEQDREQKADGYYYGDDGRKYIVCPEIANVNYFQNGLRNGAFVLQQATTVDENDSLGNKIGEVTSWSTTPWQGIDTVQDVLNTEDDAVAESEYEAKMAVIKAQDQMLDMEIKQIETQHKAVETEMDSVKDIINKNIEKTFKVFA